MITPIFRSFILPAALFAAILSGCHPSNSLLMVTEELPPPFSANAHTGVAPMQPTVGLPTPSAMVSLESSPRLADGVLVLPSSSGEQITFSQSGDKWYAATTQGKLLPVEGGQEWPSVGDYLSWLAGQDASVVRSRLHMIPSIASPTGRASVYLGKLGLLGGTPVGRKIEWYPGPHIKFSSYDACMEAYCMPLPVGYRYWGYKERPGSIVQRASCTLRYVEANSEEKINKLSEYLCQDEIALEARLSADFLCVVNLGVIGGEGRRSQMYTRQASYTSRFIHAALMVHVAKKDKLSRKESKVDVKFDIGIEPISSSLLVGYPPLSFYDRGVVTDRTLTQTEIFRHVYIPLEAFGAQDWKDYFGVEVDQEPPLPVDIEDILDEKAPFLLDTEESRQRVRDNHLLTLIPSKVNGEALTLDKLGELILPHFPENNKNDAGCSAHGYRYYSEYLTCQNRKASLSKEAYWLLLPKTVLVGSRGQEFSMQEEMVAAYSAEGYRLPYALEVATSLLSHYVRSGEQLYTNHDRKGLWTYTRCMDVDKDGYPLIVGSFGISGLSVSFSSYGYDPSGVSCCCEL